MAVTAIDLTRDHYQRPEVKEIITKYAMPGAGGLPIVNKNATEGGHPRWIVTRIPKIMLLKELKLYEDLGKHGPKEERKEPGGDAANTSTRKKVEPQRG